MCSDSKLRLNLHTADATDHTKRDWSLRNGWNMKERTMKKRSSLLSFSKKFSALFFMFRSHSLLLLLCLFFCKWQECVVGWKRYCISFSFQNQVCFFLKSSLTALMVTGFCCFLLRDALVQKSTLRLKKKKKKLCECSLDGCVLNLYSHCKIKTVCLDQCYVNVFFYSWVWQLSPKNTWRPDKKI